MDSCGGASVDIQLKSVCYSVFGLRNGHKTILKDVCGEFFSGQMSCILGPSGSGKTSLLNIIAGYKKASSGEIFINGIKRNQDKFKVFTRYIFQENLIRDGFTVYELMMFTADLKLGNYECRENKEKIILDILGSLRLNDLINSRTDILSGGEKKRLSVALELIDSPRVLILDEPTTGLDNVSSSDCIKLFKDIAKQGRIVICSIHSPSETILSYFDKMYVINKGECVYRGDVSAMLPFLLEVGLECPKSYNPADYMIEICSNEYGDFQDNMVELTKTYNNCHLQKLNCNPQEVEREIGSSISRNEPSFIHKTITLTTKMLKQTIRDKYFFLKIGIQYAVGVMIGLFFGNVGYDATRFLGYISFIFSVNLHTGYFASMNFIIWFYNERTILQREFLNSWYGLGPYYTAVLLALIPGQLLNSFGFGTIVYLLTNQPLEMSSFFFFNLTIFLLYSAFESSTMIICFCLDQTVWKLLVSKVYLVMKLIGALYDFGRGDKTSSTPLLVQVSMYVNDISYGLNTMITSTLAHRETMSCPDGEEWCVQDVNYLMKSVGFRMHNLWGGLLGLTCIVIVLRVIGFIVLRVKFSMR